MHNYTGNLSAETAAPAISPSLCLQRIFAVVNTMQAGNKSNDRLGNSLNRRDFQKVDNNRCRYEGTATAAVSTEGSPKFLCTVFFTNA